MTWRVSAVGAASQPGQRSGRVIERRGWLLLLLLAVMLFSSGFGLRDPWPPDEPRYALVAQEMVATGHWLFPRRGGEYYPDKPPLFFWILAATDQLTGSLPGAFLLPSMLAGLVTLLLVYDLGRRLWDQRTGFYAGLILLTVFQFTLQAKKAQIDGLLTLWTTLALYGLIRHFMLGPAWRWYWTACAAMGLGVITKGVGFLPVLALVPYGGARLRDWPDLPRLAGRVWQWAAGPLAMLAGVGVWLLPMLVTVAVSDNPALIAYRDNILWHQTAVRYADAWAHVHPLWYLFAQAWLLWLPVTLFLPWLVPRWWRAWRARRSPACVLVGYVLLVLVFFSISTGKRGVYILPAVPALALAAAPYLGDVWTRVGARRTALAAGLVITGTLLIGGVICGWLVPGWGDVLTGRYRIEPWTLFAAVGGVGFACLAWAGRRRALLGLAMVFWVLWLLYGWWGYTLLNPIRSSAPFMARVSERIGPSAQLGLVDWKEQQLLLAGRHATDFGFRRPETVQARAGANWLQQGKDRWLLIRDEAMRPCFSPGDAIDMGIKHRARWYLVDATALTQACR